MKPLILIKLGGSLITKKTRAYTAKPETIERLAQEIAEAREKKKLHLVVGHGSGSFGHSVAEKYRTQRGIVNKQSVFGMVLVQDAAAQLNRLVVAALIKEQLPAISVSLSSCSITEKGEFSEIFLEPIVRMLEIGLLPVVYGDVVMDIKQGCSIVSTEKILSYLAQIAYKFDYRIEKVIQTGNTAGVLDNDGDIISLITNNNFSAVKKSIGGSAGFDVTGGMRHKVNQSLFLAKKGIETIIIDGRKKGNLERAILGEEVEGTTIS